LLNKHCYAKRIKGKRKDFFVS